MRCKQYGHNSGKRRALNPFSKPLVRTVTLTGYAVTTEGKHGHKVIAFKGEATGTVPVRALPAPYSAPRKPVMAQYRHKHWHPHP